jgi:hypothetical protein
MFGTCLILLERDGHIALGDIGADSRTDPVFLECVQVGQHRVPGAGAAGYITVRPRCQNGFGFFFPLPDIYRQHGRFIVSAFVIAHLNFLASFYCVIPSGSVDRRLITL